jgi:hypothetical protein
MANRHDLIGSLPLCLGAAQPALVLQKRGPLVEGELLLELGRQG